jgi:hypothetical protein
MDMKSETQEVDIAQVFREGVLIDRALYLAYISALETHIRFNAPMVFWEDGKVVDYGPERLPALRETALREFAELYGSNGNT